MPASFRNPNLLYINLVIGINKAITNQKVAIFYNVKKQITPLKAFPAIPKKPELKDILKELYPPKTFAEKVKYHRLKKGLKQQDLAKSIGLYRTSISQYELGETKPSKRNMEKLAKILGTTPKYLCKKR